MRSSPDRYSGKRSALNRRINEANRPAQWAAWKTVVVNAFVAAPATGTIMIYSPQMPSGYSGLLAAVVASAIATWLNGNCNGAKR